MIKGIFYVILLNTWYKDADKYVYFFFELQFLKEGNLGGYIFGDLSSGDILNLLNKIIAIFKQIDNNFIIFQLH